MIYPKVLKAEMGNRGVSAAKSVNNIVFTQSCLEHKWVTFPGRRLPTREKNHPSVSDVYPACPVASENGTGVGPEDRTGVPLW